MNPFFLSAKTWWTWLTFWTISQFESCLIFVPSRLVSYHRHSASVVSPGDGLPIGKISEPLRIRLKKRKKRKKKKKKTRNKRIREKRSVKSTNQVICLGPPEEQSALVENQ